MRDGGVNENHHKNLTVLSSIAAIKAGSDLDRFDIVTTVELKQLQETRASGKTDFVLMNTLDEMIFKDSSLPGSINIPKCNIEGIAGRLGENNN